MSIRLLRRQDAGRSPLMRGRTLVLIKADRSSSCEVRDMTKKIQLSIDGKNVRPETVGIADLLEVLTKFNAALSATAKHGGMNPDDMQISLTHIEAGSNILTFTTDDKTDQYSQPIIDAINDSDVTTLPAAARRPIIDLWKKTCNRSWEGIGVARQNGRTASATIQPSKPLFEHADLHGSTAIVAYIIRVGGEGKPTANIRLSDGEKLTAGVSTRSVAEHLGELLFKHVEVKGDAVWSVPGWKLTGFVITGVGDYMEETSNPVEALDDLADASGGFWDTVDPTAYIEQHRTE